MKFKNKVFISALLIVLVLTVSAVAAQDNSTVDGTDSEANNMKTKDSVLSQDNEGSLSENNDGENELLTDSQSVGETNYTGKMDVVSASNEMHVDKLNTYNNILTQTDNLKSTSSESEVLNADEATFSTLINEVGVRGNIILQHKYYKYDSGGTIYISQNGVMVLLLICRDSRVLYLMLILRLME